MRLFDYVQIKLKIYTKVDTFPGNYNFKTCQRRHRKSKARILYRNLEDCQKVSFSK